MADSAMTDAPPDEPRLHVRFVTRDADIAVPDAPILIPASFQRLGLSQVVNHLLARDRPVPFDFLVDNAFLRTSLGAYLAQHGLSTESTLTLEYVRATVPPKFLASFEHDDWVSAVAVSRAPVAPVILSGSYDGIARVWSQSGEVLAQAAGHAAAIKTAAWTSDAGAFVTGGMDRALRLWTYDAEAGTADCAAELLGHTSTVEDVAVSPNNNGRILSASADGTLRLWSTDVAALPAAPEALLPTRLPKRRKVAASAAEKHLPRVGSLAALAGHASPVAAVRFDPRDASVAYSAGWDHSLRTWDLATLACVDARTTQHPLLSVCVLPALGLLAAGTAARHITLHDPRADASAVTSSVLRGHTNAVVGLSASPENEWQMASAGHDGSVRVWDVRATGSGNLFTVGREGGGKEKVFGVEWAQLGIVSGGEDKKVQVNEVPRVADGPGPADTKEKL